MRLTQAEGRQGIPIPGDDFILLQKLFRPVWLEALDLHQPLGLALGGEGVKHQEAADALLEEDPQSAVHLLHVLVQLLEPFAKQRRQNQHRKARRDQDGRKAQVQRHDHHQGAHQLDEHPRQPRQDLRIAVGHHRGVIGQAVDPLPGVHRADPGVIPVQNLGEEPPLEDILDGGAKALIEPSVEGAGRQLCQHNQQDQQHIPPEPGTVRGGGAVHNAAHQQRVEHARDAQKRVQRRQDQDIAPLRPRHPVQPFQRLILHLSILSPPCGADSGPPSAAECAGAPPPSRGGCTGDSPARLSGAPGRGAQSPS